MYSTNMGMHLYGSIFPTTPPGTVKDPIFDGELPSEAAQQRADSARKPIKNWAPFPVIEF